MKKILLLFLGVLAIIGIKAEDLSHIELLQAINKGRPYTVRQYLQKGAQLNQKVGGYKETPLMFAIRAFAKEAEDRYSLANSFADIGKGIGWMTLAPMGTFGMGLLPLGLFFQIHNDVGDIATYILAIPITAEIGYGAYTVCKGLGKAVGMVPYSNFRLYKRKKVIELLIDYPTIDLFVTNSKGQTALDLIHSYMLTHAENLRLFYILKQVEYMLLDKQRKIKTRGD